MKRRVKNRDLGHARKQLAAGKDALQIGGIVQGRQGAEAVYGGDGLVINQDRVAIFLAAVNHAMPYGANFLERAEALQLRAGQQLEKVLQRHRVLRQLQLFPNLPAVGGADDDGAQGFPDALD